MMMMRYIRRWPSLGHQERKTRYTVKEGRTTNIPPSTTKISQSLLHRRLGHRSMSTILMAHEDEIWDDANVILDSEEFCETCRITTARKSNRGPWKNLGKSYLVKLMKYGPYL